MDADLAPLGRLGAKDRPRAFGQHFSRSGFAPIPAIGWDREWLVADHLAPDATREAEAITTDATQAGLIMVGRAKPTAGGGDNQDGISAIHRTFPSWPPSWLA